MKRLAKAKEVRLPRSHHAGAKFEDQARKGRIRRHRLKAMEWRHDLGTVPGRSGRWFREFDEVVFKAPVGQVTEPIKTAYGYHLILVEERKSKPYRGCARGRIEQKIRPEMGQKNSRGPEGQDAGGVRRGVFRQVGERGVEKECIGGTQDACAI